MVDAEENYKFKQDPAGSFKIMVEDGHIKAVHYLKMEPQIAIKGKLQRLFMMKYLKEV